MLYSDLIWKLMSGYLLNFYIFKKFILYIPLICSDRRWIKSYHNLKKKKAITASLKVLSTLKVLNHY